MMNAKMKRKIKLFGHFLKHNQFVIIIMEEEINGKRINDKVGKSFIVEIFLRMSSTPYQRFTQIVSDRHE